jgi:hypothetical protein
MGNPHSQPLVSQSSQILIILIYPQIKYPESLLTLKCEPLPHYPDPVDLFKFESKFLNELKYLIITSALVQTYL